MPPKQAQDDGGKDEKYEEQASEYSDADIQGYVQQKESEMQNYMSKGNAKGAVTAACTDTPTLWTKNKEMKAAFATTVFGAMNQLKEADFAPFVDSLNEDQRDILMKFIYKGLETGEYPNFFKLHAVLFEKSGYGCIVRAISERKNV